MRSSIPCRFDSPWPPFGGGRARPKIVRTCNLHDCVVRFGSFRIALGAALSKHVKIHCSGYVFRSQSVRRIRRLCSREAPRRCVKGWQVGDLEMSQQICRPSELYTNPGHFPRSGATRWPWARLCRRRTRLVGRSGPPIRAKQQYHHGFYGLALLPCFLHSFRTLAPLYCHGPSYIDTRGDFVLLHLAVGHGNFQT